MSERAASDARTGSHVVTTFAYGPHLWFLDATRPVLHRWADRHGWDVAISVDPRLAAGRPLSWAKVPLMRELLDHFEWVWFIDADAVIVDLDRDPLEAVDDGHDLYLASHPHQADGSGWLPNFGVVLIRSTDRARCFLDEVWAADRHRTHAWWENAAVIDLLGYDIEPPYTHRRATEWTDMVGHLDLAWNSVPGYCEAPNPAIRHHARADHGCFDRRLRAIRADVEVTP